MLLSFEIKKVYTDNPYVDELVYYAKLLGMGTVLKMQQLADNNETAKSIKAADLYIACIEKTAILELFPRISRSSLIKGGIIDEETISRCMRNRNTIPAVNRPDVLEALRLEYIENYEELNPYYRMLHGLPAIGKEDYVTDWVPPEGTVIDLSKPIHMMNSSEINILDNNGILDIMIAEDPIGREYIRHMNEKRIDYYTARKANRFDVLYIPEISTNSVYRIYRDMLENNKFYALRAVYSEAFKYNSDYYDNFIAIFIVLMTIIDMISRVQEFIIRKEIFDIRSVQYIFESNGITFFPEIPLKYQIKMVKNLHTLLKYKSTKKCMIDICSLFGFENIEIFKYYLCRDKINENSSMSNPENYELKFLKLPLDGRLDQYSTDKNSYVSYDDVTSKDPTWDGGLDHDEVYNSIREQEFNFSRSKYISITTIYDVAKMSVQQSYFFNFLYDNIPLEDLCTIRVPFIDTNANFNIADIFIFLNILTYYYNNMEDTIVDTQGKVLYINGFNFRADLSALAEDIVNCDEAKELLAQFKSPNTQIPSFSDMVSIFINNMDVRDMLINGMINADNKRIYDIYKKLYDSLMVAQLTLDFYKNPLTGDFYRFSENSDPTYTEFLKNRNDILYNLALKVKSFEDEISRNQYISTLIDNIVWSIEEFIDSSKFQGIFASLPINSLEVVKNYIAKVINFYKSFKVHFLGFDTQYQFGSSDTEFIKVIEGINQINTSFSNIEYISPFDDIDGINTSLCTHDSLDIRERMYIDYVYDTDGPSDPEHPSDPDKLPYVVTENETNVIRLVDINDVVTSNVIGKKLVVTDPSNTITYYIDDGILYIMSDKMDSDKPSINIKIDQSINSIHILDSNNMVTSNVIGKKLVVTDPSNTTYYIDDGVLYIMSDSV